jgi:hypothetical protein
MSNKNDEWTQNVSAMKKFSLMYRLFLIISHILWWIYYCGAQQINTNNRKFVIGVTIHVTGVSFNPEFAFWIFILSFFSLGLFSTGL